MLSRKCFTSRNKLTYQYKIQVRSLIGFSVDRFKVTSAQLWIKEAYELKIIK